MDATFSSYHGIAAGEWLRHISTGRIGRCLRVEEQPDGLIVECESVDGTRWGAYLDQCEFGDDPTKVQS